MGSVVATVSEDTAKNADRAKARKHPNYIDIGAIFSQKSQSQLVNKNVRYPTIG